MAETTKKHIITISGRPASGKSTAAKAIAAQLGYQHFSSGDLFRALAKEKGIDLLQANLSAEENAELDHMVDARLQEIGRTENEQVIDSRTAWHWMPSSFKVFLDLDLREGAKRILGDLDEARLANEHVHADADEYVGSLQRRLESESRRYKKLYDIDPYDMSNYDLVVDTFANTPEEVVAKVLGTYEAWLQS